MTTQEMYEAQVAYFSQPGAVLAKVGDQCAPEGNKCCYRTREGNKCAIGCVMPDRLYDSSMENKSFEDLRALDYPFMDWLMQDADKDLWSWADETQNLHDNEATSAKELVRSLHRLARQYGLRSCE